MTSLHITLRLTLSRPSSTKLQEKNTRRSRRGGKTGSLAASAGWMLLGDDARAVSRTVWLMLVFFSAGLLRTDFGAVGPLAIHEHNGGSMDALLGWTTQGCFEIPYIQDSVVHAGFAERATVRRIGGAGCLALAMRDYFGTFGLGDAGILSTPVLDSVASLGLFYFRSTSKCVDLEHKPPCVHERTTARCVRHHCSRSSAHERVERDSPLGDARVRWK